MTEINEKDECIEVKEYLTFNGTVQPIYNEFLEEAESELFDIEESFDEDAKKRRAFLNYKLTHEDKIEILENIDDEFQRCDNYFDNASIFDRQIIIAALENWINEKFDLEIYF